MVPALELLFPSYDALKQNFRIFALLYIFPVIVGLSNGFWVVDTNRHLKIDSLDAANAVVVPGLPAYAYGRLGVFFLLALIVAIIVRMMLQVAQLKSAQGKKITVLSLWRVVKQRWQQLLALYIASSLIISVWMIPAFIDHRTWVEIVCFIPALYFLRRFFVAPYVLIEHQEMNFWQAMARSSELTHKDSRSVYTLIGVMLLFALFGIVPFIGWIFAFWLLFMYCVAPAIRYQELKRLG